MGVEWNYVNIKTKRFIELGKDFTITGSSWKNIFNDFQKYKQPWPVEYIHEILENELLENERTYYMPVYGKGYDWEFWKPYLKEVSENIFNFLSDGRPEDFIWQFDDCFLEDKITEDELRDITGYKNREQTLIWTRYKNK